MGVSEKVSNESIGPMFSLDTFSHHAQSTEWSTETTSPTSLEWLIKNGWAAAGGSLEMTCGKLHLALPKSTVLKKNKKKRFPKKPFKVMRKIKSHQKSRTNALGQLLFQSFVSKQKRKPRCLLQLCPNCFFGFPIKDSPFAKND